MDVASAETSKSTLPLYEIVNDSVPQPLTDRSGDAMNGRAVFLDRERGHCLLCHRIASVEEPFQGTLGPDLSKVAERLSPAQMRLRLIDSTHLNPDTVMPAYYRVDNLRQVGKDYRGKPVLGAQEIEDLIAYLNTLRTAK